MVLGIVSTSAELRLGGEYCQCLVSSCLSLTVFYLSVLIVLFLDSRLFFFLFHFFLPLCHNIRMVLGSWAESEA